MYILNPEQIKRVDQATIERESIAGTDLMERAAGYCTDWLINNTTIIEAAKIIHVFCGPGNNGGDGLVIARKLFQKGFTIALYNVLPEKKNSTEFAVNAKRAADAGLEMINLSDESLPLIDRQDLIIDAVFGVGLNQPVTGKAKELIQMINSSGAKVISIDIPSGLFAEKNLKNDASAIVRAYITLTFQQPKLSFLLSDNTEFVGKWYLIDIGLDQDSMAKMNCDRIFLTNDFLRFQYKPRPKFSHKGTFGHALIIGGSFGKMGAMVLAANASVRSGAGLTSAYVPSALTDIMQISVPEAMVIRADEEECIGGLPKLDPYTAVAIGPGMGMTTESENTLKNLIQHSNVPLIIDADALNILANNKTWLSFLNVQTVLTPHPKEFDRLFGKHSTAEERLETQQKMSVKYAVFIVLKGAHTSISCPDGRLYFNSTGNPGMASGGMGDALTGMLAGLSAGPYNFETAIVLAVYLHGLAGDLSLAKESMESLKASDLISNLGKAFKSIAKLI